MQRDCWSERNSLWSDKVNLTSCDHRRFSTVSAFVSHVRILSAHVVAILYVYTETVTDPWHYYFTQQHHHTRTGQALPLICKKLSDIAYPVLPGVRRVAKSAFQDSLPPALSQARKLGTEVGENILPE